MGDGDDSGRGGPPDPSLGRHDDVAHRPDGAEADLGGREDRLVDGAGQPAIPGLEQSFALIRQGPIPHPGELAGYDSIVPGAAQDLIQAHLRREAVTSDALERTSQTEAHTATTTAEAEAFALRLFAVGYIAFFPLLLVVGAILLICGVSEGTAVALFGAIGIFVEAMSRVVGRMRSASPRRDDGTT